VESQWALRRFQWSDDNDGYEEISSFLLTFIELEGTHMVSIYSAFTPVLADGLPGGVLRFRQESRENDFVIDSFGVRVSKNQTQRTVRLYLHPLKCNIKS
jgi:hypothetical protein